MALISLRFSWVKFTTLPVSFRMLRGTGDYIPEVEIATARRWSTGSNPGHATITCDRFERGIPNWAEFTDLSIRGAAPGKDLILTCRSQVDSHQDHHIFNHLDNRGYFVADGTAISMASLLGCQAFR